jgi:putative hydrolase of the HAD superfamily
MGQRITTIGFDADDTLWQNETFYRMTQDRFRRASGRLHRSRPSVGATAGGGAPEPRALRLRHQGVHAVDDRNRHRGHGAARARRVIAEILAAGRRCWPIPSNCCPRRRTRCAACESHTLVLITKGDLLDQERKLAQSGLGELFDAVEIVSDKTRVGLFPRFRAHGDGPDSAMMIGNSMKSDVLPAIEAGAWGVFVPHGLTWELEHAGTRGPSAIS